MILPTTSTKPAISMATDLTLFYGRPGEGKTYLANSVPNKTLLFDFDNGARALSCFALDCHSEGGYKNFVEGVKQLCAMPAAERSKVPYSTVTIDTVTKCLDAIEADIVKRNKVADINSGSLSYGKGLVMLREEFTDAVTALRRCGWGVFLLAHSTAIEMTDEFGTSYMQEVPALGSEKTRTAILAECDHVVRISTQHDVDDAGKNIIRRVLTGTPSMCYTAKSRGGVYSYNMLATWDAVGKAYTKAQTTPEKETTKK